MNSCVCHLKEIQFSFSYSRSRSFSLMILKEDSPEISFPKNMRIVWDFFEISLRFSREFNAWEVGTGIFFFSRVFSKCFSHDISQWIFSYFFIDFLRRNSQSEKFNCKFAQNLMKWNEYEFIYRTLTNVALFLLNNK